MVVGGERWWQIRGLDGIDSEWITEKEYVKSGNKYPAKSDDSLSDAETKASRMEHLETVMVSAAPHSFYRSCRLAMFRFSCTFMVVRIHVFFLLI